MSSWVPPLGPSPLDGGLLLPVFRVWEEGGLLNKRESSLVGSNPPSVAGHIKEWAAAQNY
eukprot:scaffold2845_cov65-Skeletonema_dohrnii-CCMP3373.AAC.1